MPLSVNGRYTATVSVGTSTECFVGSRTHGATLGTTGAVLAGWQMRSSKMRKCVRKFRSFLSKPGQEKFLFLVTPQSYKVHLRKVLQGPNFHNCTPAVTYVDEFNKTKSD